MSVIYSTLTSIINRISDEFHKSFLFSTIFSVLGFIENQWVSSFFKGLYPGENFLSFLNKNNILKNHIFNPLIVIFLFALFLILSLNPPSTSLVITLALAFVGFFIGSAIAPRYFLNKTTDSIVRFDRRDIYSIGFCLLLISIVFFFISIASVGGIPLLKPSIRYLLKPMFTMPVFLIIPATCMIASAYLKDYNDGKITRSQARFRFLFLLAIDCAFLLLLGYRTPLLAAFLIIIIIGFYGNIVSLWEVVVGALIGIGAIIGIGYFRSLGEMTITSSTSPFYTLQSRADFTLHVLNLLDFIGGNFGLTHGHMLASAIPGSDLGPRMMVGKLIAWRTEVTVTPTLIGQMVVDFGKVGVFVGMCLLGFILGIGFKIMQKTKDFFYIGIYALILTYAILGIETGILDIQVLFYFIIAIFIYFVCIKRSISN
ncbi:MAG: oligosaccharide repeat unit polymerase [Methanobrevibacter thaueri]|jgi:oligosaccharide repeat unit polymerase|uniref:oligosaccharide repeat unit polymerase family protein n=1 Tax=Methanobrevibacter thaueri TaxID=190975 RepID=UPI0026EDD7C1|nr:oligosaccharide repeat unit polymerase family protein [Methanobrevibacter thaueri]MBE6495102.1 oligosaccharide repeat unit polymerase [Methanobrevibacter thaueri]